MAVTTGLGLRRRSPGNILVLEVVLACLYAQCPTIYCVCSVYSIVFNSGVASYGALGHVPPPHRLPNMRVNYPILCSLRD